MSDKNKHTVWLSDDIWDKVESHYQTDNCTTRNEYIEKAIRFYTGYLHAKKSSDYLPRLISETLEAHLDMLGSRIGRLLFKLTVEISMMMHVLAAGLEIDNSQLDDLRWRCVQEVKKTNGGISFKDTLREHDNGGFE